MFEYLFNTSLSFYNTIFFTKSQFGDEKDLIFTFLSKTLPALVCDCVIN